MIICPTKTRSEKRRSRNAFTFVEVLMALVFMAVLVPVVMQSMTISNRAAAVSERKSIATRLANNLLTELVVTGTWNTGSSSGEFEEDWYSGYRWAAERLPWESPQSTELTALTVEVFYQAQGVEYSVRLSTLINEEEENTL